VIAVPVDLAAIVAITGDYAPTAGPNDAYPPGRFTPEAERRWFIEATLGGIELGDYDRRIIEWLAQWDDCSVRVIVSLLVRSRRAGYAEAASGRPPGIDSEAWTCRGCGGQMIGDRGPNDLCRDCARAGRESAP
jgi:hypothetical protein